MFNGFPFVPYDPGRNSLHLGVAPTDGQAGCGELTESAMYPTTKWILIVISVLAVLASVVLLKYPGSKEAAEIFEWARTILPPLATLILGFHFI